MNKNSFFFFGVCDFVCIFEAGGEVDVKRMYKVL